MCNRRTTHPALAALGSAVLCAVLAGCVNTDSASSDSADPAKPAGGAAASRPGSSSSADSGADQAGREPGATAGNEGAGDNQNAGDQHSNAGGSSAEPGFADAAAEDDRLPDLRDSSDDPAPAAPPTADTSADAGTTTRVDASGAGGATADTPGIDATGGRGSIDPDGALTEAERVAVLEAELERATGDFDDLILAEQEEQRRRERERASAATASPQPERDPGSQRAAGYGGGMVGGSSGSAGSAPANPVKYEPPEDIPSGDSDDVVARQLREAAMREPDPAVRAKLWDEYRKYKGMQ